MKKQLFKLALASLLMMTPLAASAGSHGGMDHSKHAGMEHSNHSDMMPMAGKKKASAMGVLHRVDVDGKIVNLTHDPIPALGWPEMTMDLAVTKKVDLSSYKAGDKVHFTVKKGRDERFRIIKMMKH
uniref:Cation efflux system protein CusF n=1 Tax=Magnetococcus massalia (strain MO-1) TaxID=451514 RepID=A0A1S7LKT4_MAGMO|nr:Conserved protein of unknown function. Putative cation efflux system protein in periplasmic [Candidatus Magnetococcus massalia]